MALPVRSFVIPVLDVSPHSPYHIGTLLRDLDSVAGEVICVFNSAEAYHGFGDDPRIDKYCLNSQNAGVSRSWNMGLQLAESMVAFLLNADLHVRLPAIERLQFELGRLPQAVIVGPQGSLLDYRRLAVARYFERGSFDEPIRTDDVSGFFFAIELERYRQHRLLFDARFSPCFFEEWDIGLQAREENLACYAVPVAEFDHFWGVSHCPEARINYFGSESTAAEIWQRNARKFMDKWRHRYPEVGADWLRDAACE